MACELFYLKRMINEQNDKIDSDMAGEREFTFDFNKILFNIENFYDFFRSKCDWSDYILDKFVAIDRFF